MADFTSDKVEGTGFVDFNGAQGAKPLPPAAKPPPPGGARSGGPVPAAPLTAGGWSRDRPFPRSQASSEAAQPASSIYKPRPFPGQSQPPQQSSRPRPFFGQSQPRPFVDHSRPRPFPSQSQPRLFRPGQSQPRAAGFKRPAASAPAAFSPAKRFPLPTKMPSNEERNRNFVMPDDAPENFKQLVENQLCSLCSASINSVVSAEMHYNGKGHQKQLRDNGLQAGEYFSGVMGVQGAAQMAPDGQCQMPAGSLPEGMDPRYCRLCDVTFTNTIQMFQHYSGKKHRTNAKDSRKVADALKAEVKVFCCDVCSIFTNTQASLDDHMNGVKHQINVAEAASGTSKADQFDSQAAHMASQEHNTQLESKQAISSFLSSMRVAASKGGNF